MRERRPTSAAGDRWRKWGAEPPPLDPDPLTLHDVAAAPVVRRRRTDEGGGCGLLLLWALIVGVLFAVGVLFVLAQPAPRSSPDPTAPPPAGDLSQPGEGASVRSSSGAPYDVGEPSHRQPSEPGEAGANPAVGARGAPPWPAAAQQPTTLVASEPASIGTALRVTKGWATVDEGQGVGHAAAGPRLRALLGPGWRGTIVTVSKGDRSIVVRLTDSCGCDTGSVKLIDLDERDFHYLTGRPPGKAWVRVTVGGDAPSPTLPPTDTED